MACVVLHLLYELIASKKKRAHIVGELFAASSIDGYQRIRKKGSFSMSIDHTGDNAFFFAIDSKVGELILLNIPVEIMRFA